MEQIDTKSKKITKINVANRKYKKGKDGLIKCPFYKKCKKRCKGLNVDAVYKHTKKHHKAHNCRES